MCLRCFLGPSPLMDMGRPVTCVTVSTRGQTLPLPLGLLSTMSRAPVLLPFLFRGTAPLIRPRPLEHTNRPDSLSLSETFTEPVPALQLPCESFLVQTCVSSRC